MKDKLRETVKMLSFFAEASEKTLEKAAAGEVKTFEKGDIIYSPEAFFDGIGLVVSGKVTVFGKNRETPVLLNVLECGNAFGVAALFGGSGEYVSTVCAGTGCRILFISEEKMKEIITEDPKVAFAYIRFLTERIRFLNGKIAGFSASTAEEAVSLYLLENGREEGIPFSVNVSRLAGSAGIGRMSVYRAFHSLSEENIISFDEGNVTILTKNGLLKKAGKK